MTGAGEAGGYLRQLLEQAGPYRERWERLASRVAGTRVNVDAVSKVLAAHRSQFDPTGPDYRSLNDTVRRALAGQVLPMGTLTDFIEAFEIAPAEAAHLRDLLRGTPVTRAITGDALPPQGLYETIGPRRHQTVAVDEVHEVGADRLPLRHRTIQTIRAIDGDVDHYTYSFDTNAASIRVVRGGEVGKLYRVTDELFAVDIDFGYVVPEGQTATFEYETTFAYSEPPPPAFRRGVFGHMDTVVLEVRFSSYARPRSVWWAEWADLGHDSIKREEQVELDNHSSVHCHYEQVSQAIIGYHWSWD